MLAEKIMVTDVVTALEDDLVSDVFKKMRASNHRMLPVIDANKCIVGVLSTFCVLEHVVPDYLISGDLKEISYAPDMGILSRHYQEIADQPIKNVMSKKPLCVNQSESILSVAAALSSFGRHEYAMVINSEKHLLGIISAGDILDRLAEVGSEVTDA